MRLVRCVAGYRDGRRHRWRQREAGASGASVSSRRYADQSAVLVEPLDRVPVDLELAEDDGGKVNPAGA